MADSKTISMLDLRANLTEVLTSTAAGTTYTITRFGTPVATLTSIEVQATPTDASHPSRRPAPASDPVRAE